MQPGHFLTGFLDALPNALKYYSKDDRIVATAVAKLARSRGVVFTVDGYSKPEVDIEECFCKIPLTPPYPITVLEYELPPPKNLIAHKAPRPRVLVVQQEGEDVVLIPIEYYHEGDVGWIPPYAMFKISRDGDAPVSIAPLLNNSFAKAQELMTGENRDINDVMSNVMIADLATYAEFCRTLHEHEVTFAEVVPDAAKNRMRRARGKAPLFTYKVLTIGKKKRKSRHLGGTHASPRSHLRRGYYRTSRNGVRHWVQPCMVKGDTDGFVHKDYKVEGQAQCS